MENKNTGLKVLVVILTVLVLALGGFIVYDKVLSKDSNTANSNPTTCIEDVNKYTADKSIVITENGKVISNTIPDELIGKYTNKNHKSSYIELTNNQITVSEPTGGETINVFKNEQIKLFINYLNRDEDLNQYITVEFFIEDNGYNQKKTYSYIGTRSSHDNEFHFKAIDPTPVGGEGSNDYPYSK